MRVSIAIAIGLFLSAAQATAAGVPDDCKSSDGRAAWIAGSAAFDKSDHSEAAAQFEIAYKKCGDPALLFNLGQTYRKLGQFEDARDRYNQWLQAAREGDPDIPAVQKKVAELDALITAQASNPPEGLKEQNRNTAPGSDVDPPVSPEQSPAPALMTESPRWYEDKVGWSVTAAGVVALGVGMYFLASAQTAADDAAQSTSEAALRDRTDEGRQDQLLGTVFGIGGAAITVVGVGLLIWNPDSSESSHDVSARSARVRAGFGSFVIEGVF